MSQSQGDARVCGECGALLAPGALEGLCPRCLMQLNLASPTELGPGGDTTLTPAGAATNPVRWPSPAEIARHFPQLEIVKCLGRGGMGVVYQARQKSLNRWVALKLLVPGKEGDSEFAARFAREAQTLARLNHPSIVAVHDFGEANGLFYLLMEYVDGASLRHLLQAHQLTPEQALAIVPKICEALQYAHDRGVVHRDIKPENILLDREGRVKIADFGIAKIARPEEGLAALTQDCRVVGTPHYMAPEQVERPHLVDHRADIYSLGVVFYEMLTGELPLGKFLPPSRKASVDPRLDQVVLRALEKEPELRYQQASQVKTGLEDISHTVLPDPSIESGVASSSRPPAAGDDQVGASGGSAVPVWIVVLRWSARALSTLVLLGVAGFLVDRGLPPLGRLPESLQLTTVAWLLVIAGCLAGWRWEGVAGLLIGCGWALFPLVDRRVTPGWNSLPLPWMLLLAILFVLCWWGTRGRRTRWVLGGASTVSLILLAAALWTPPDGVRARIPPRDPQAGRNLIDLTSQYNAALGDNWHDPLDRDNHLGELPQGVQSLAGTTFDVRGLIQVELKCQKHPPRIEGIAVDQVCHRLHFLHAAINAAWFENGTLIGQYRIHFANGETREVPITLGENVGDWYSKDTYAPVTVAWIGESPKSRREGKRIVLFKCTWPNPLPEVPIKAIDMVAARRGPSPFLIAVTVE